MNSTESITNLLARLGKWYAAIPYRCFPSGYALPPLHYYFEITRRCQLRCRMCQYRDFLEKVPVARQSEGELTTQEWRQVIDQTGWFSLITFTGGEPWMRDDCGKLLEYASARRRTHLITNGLLLDDSRRQLCIDLAPSTTGGRGLCFIGISIDGPGSVHDYIRRSPGAFDKVTACVRALSDLRKRSGKKYPLIHVTSVIQPDNFERLPEMAAIVKDIGADIYNLTLEIRYADLLFAAPAQPCDAKTAVVAIAPPAIDPERLKAVLQKIRQSAQNAGIPLRMPRMPDCEIVNYFAGRMALDNFRCLAPWSTLTIDSQGTVYPCLLNACESVRLHKLRHIWNGKRMRSFRQTCRKPLPSLCGGCCELLSIHGAGNNAGSGDPAYNNQEHLL